jgi:hypothetical protein
VVVVYVVKMIEGKLQKLPFYSKEMAKVCLGHDKGYMKYISGKKIVREDYEFGKKVRTSYTKT